MNDNLKKPQPNEEIDLGQLFNAIGKLFDRLFKFIGSIFKAIFSFIIFILKVVIENIKLIVAVVLITFILGFAIEKQRSAVYSSEMLVKPYFDSKYQLVSNVTYFNSLIAIGDTEKLSQIFEIPEESAKTLKSFEINPGPQSENEKVKEYDEYIKSIDSIRGQQITLKAYLESRDIYAGDFFEISVKSTKRDIFISLEEGLNKSFKNTYSERVRQKRDTLIALQKANLLASIASVDSLQRVYIEVLKNDAESGSKSISFGDGFSLEPDSRSKTKEFELLNKEIELRNKLNQLDERKIEEDTFFDTVSSFQEIGNKTTSLRERYAFIFPILGFLILTIIFCVFSTIKFVRNYER